MSDAPTKPLRFKRSPKGAKCVYALGCDLPSVNGLWLCPRHLRIMKKLGAEHRAKYQEMIERARHVASF
jgi:hypothetical protein